MYKMLTLIQFDQIIVAHNKWDFIQMSCLTISFIFLLMVIYVVLHWVVSHRNSTVNTNDTRMTWQRAHLEYTLCHVHCTVYPYMCCVHSPDTKTHADEKKTARWWVSKWERNELVASILLLQMNRNRIKLNVIRVNELRERKIKVQSQEIMPENWISNLSFGLSFLVNVTKRNRNLFFQSYSLKKHTHTSST